MELLDIRKLARW